MPKLSDRQLHRVVHLGIQIERTGRSLSSSGGILQQSVLDDDRLRQEIEYVEIFVRDAETYLGQLRELWESIE